MKLTKTWLSYIVWGFFSIIFFTNIGIAAIEIYIKNEMTDFLMPMLVLYGGTMAGIILLISLYKLFEKYVLPKMSGESSTLHGVGEWISFAMVILVAIAVRAIAIVAATGQPEGTMIFYDYAISGGNGVELSVHNNGSYIYCGLLGFILGFLGHIPSAAMGVQTVIQIMAIVITYFMLKKALGLVPAWISLALLSFLPGSFFAVRTLTPDSLFVLLFSLYMFALVYLCAANREQKIRGKLHILFYVLIGAFAAFLAFYDMSGLIAFVIGIVAFVQSKNEEAWLKIQRPFMQVLFFSISFIFVWLLLVWFMPTGGIEAGPAAVMAYIKSFVPTTGLNLMIMTPHKGQWDSVALFIMAGLWFVGFLRTKHDKGFPYAIMIVFLTLTSFLGIGAYDYTLFSSFLWSILAAIGLSSINDFRKTERDVEIAEKNKENTAKRKEQRERRRAEASGEKSIRLDDVNHQKAMQDPVLNRDKKSNIDGSAYASATETKKSYGVGRKAEEVQPVVSEPVADITVSNVSVQNTAEPVTSVYETASQPYENKTVVKKVDRPPLGMTTSYPYRDTSGTSYTQPSRSRRSLRTPSKSTFTPEDLERISRYTGVSYMTSQIVQPKTEDTYTDIVEDTVTTVENMEPVQETPASDAGYIELATPSFTETTTVEAVETKEDGEAVETIIETEVMDTVNTPEKTESAEVTKADAEYQEKDISVDVSEHSENDIQSETTQTDVKTETKTKVQEVPAYTVYNPSRRHFRYPSKSTFTPEELERISQFTGVNYLQPAVDKLQENSTGKLSDETEKPGNVVENAGIPDREKNTTEQNERISKPENNVMANRSVVRNITPTKPSDSDDDTVHVIPITDRKPKMIRNPLPGPKPHVAKELNYDYIPKESEMDFDIKDLKGKDFYDL